MLSKVSALSAFALAGASLVCGAGPMPQREGAAAAASALASRADCGQYTIISTRGTGEIQGPSIAFATMVRDTLSNVTGGAEYDTKYAADISQLSEAGTVDVLNKINDSLKQCPDHKFALLGYSQGATVTTEALVRIPDNSDAFKAVVAVVTVGNPRHNKGLQSNFDTDGGKSTAQGFGLLSYLSPIPDYWDKSGKVLDVCAHGDGVCDVTSGIGVGPPHFLYTTSQFTQDRATGMMTSGFKGGEANSSSPTGNDGGSGGGSGTDSNSGGGSGGSGGGSDAALQLSSAASGYAALLVAGLLAVSLTTF